MQPLKRKGSTGSFAPEAARELVGQVFEGRYRVERQIGQGGIGVVYRAVDTKLGGRPVAVKVLNDRMGARSKQRKRFEREAKALASLSNPHVVSVIDYGVADETPYLVMELLEGRSLSQVISAEAPIAPERAFGLMRQMLAGLCYVHERGLVHRDLKSANVFVQELAGAGERVKLLDFGLVKFLEANEEATLTASGEIFGTPGYMPPEQWLGKSVDARADVYSAAVILYEMLAGQKPFQGPLADVAQKQLAGVVPKLGDAGTGRRAHPALEALLARGMAASASARFEDGPALAKALAALPADCVQVLSERERAAEVRDKHEAVTRPATSEAKTLADVRAAAKKPGLFARMLAGIWSLVASLLRAGAWLLSVLSVLVIAGALAVIYVFKHPELEEGQDALRDVLPAAVVGDVKPKAPVQAEPPHVNEQTPARDPWQRPVPAALKSARGLVVRRKSAGEVTFAQVRRFNVDHPDDARGHLVLGALYFQRNWLDDGLTQYELALRIDPSARGDVRMTRDLLALATQSNALWSRARTLLKREYGAEARADAERAAAAAKDADARTRLSALAEDLAQTEAP